MKPASAIVILLFGIFVGISPCHAASSISRSGETLVYQIRWSFVPAGEVRIRTEPDTVYASRPVRHFSLTARTLPMIDLFYKVRDRIDSLTDMDLGHSLLYTKKQQGKNRRDITVNFDWHQKEAVYTNFSRSEPPVRLLPNTLDPLSAYFYLRRLPLKVGDVIKAPVTDGKKIIVGTAKVLRRERVATPLSSFATIVVEPSMKGVRGVFEKTRDARMLLWLTDDPRHLLVRARSKVAVGSFVAELMAYEQGGP